ncbi:hypothetical protein EYF80_021352 [Liparis tanakae]|uniref:Uncharacterized protein n=1 Tax=Liparis tanakae TaxID=230148 RepID=A0A4Z2HSA3_9TELE|nr:hypothetical protein EYF80_021352 [Liparis tanakae]
MEKVVWEEEKEGWAGHGRRPESDQGDVAGRWQMEKSRWRKVDTEQEERGMPVQMEGRKVEQVMDRTSCLELQEERTRWRGKHTLRTVGEMWVDVWPAGRKSPPALPKQVVVSSSLIGVCCGPTMGTRCLPQAESRASLARSGDTSGGQVSTLQTPASWKPLSPSPSASINP